MAAAWHNGEISPSDTVVSVGKEVVKETTKPTETAQNKPQTESVVFTMKTLRKGDKGTQVKVLQWLLNDNGFDCGTADGIYGSKTLAAVKAYQKAHGLTADGIVGRNTWTQLIRG